MTTSTRSIRLLAGTTCAVIALTGCSTTMTGTPLPVTVTSKPNTSSTGTNLFGNLTACQVLDQVLTGQGFAPGERITRRNECDASKPGYASYGLALDPVQGLAEFKKTDPGAVPTDINGRNAMQAPSKIEGQCLVAIEVGAHARAVVDVTLSSLDTAAACSDARQLAQQVEPLLPKGQ
ncbi:DUF3558 domain-containing protein [Amycolatopsis cynarae]|uniref:DUF3558 domain-containing protein n=1 Tax=Amycolatopsis cynarae TaxID=2995223 RepID=A0ABY7B403_9PSEU|nr:DUF3558 domain-containing protein [Amycolatopsis sp. HUAS 11-8]WAL67061.1 DUF3558 domain-containing protein [Amycolatopsis sp. HUAS 11-8]